MTRCTRTAHARHCGGRCCSTQRAHGPRALLIPLKRRRGGVASCMDGRTPRAGACRRPTELSPRRSHRGPAAPAAYLGSPSCPSHAACIMRGHMGAMLHAARRTLHRRTPTKVSSAARRRQASAYVHRWRRVEHRWRIDQRSCRRTETQRALQRRNMQDATRLDASTEACIPKRVRARAGALSFAKAPRRFTVHVARRALHGEPLRRLPAAFYMLQLRAAALPQPMRAVASAVSAHSLN